MNRSRACCALIVDGHILMVRHRTPEREFLTLPGGGVEPGEDAPRAAERELLEETGIHASASRLLFEGSYAHGKELCFLMSSQGVDISAALPGTDPEEEHLPEEDRQLKGLAWMPLSEVREDGQVARVMRALEA